MTQESIGSTPPQQPSIGRIVHYQRRGSADGVFAPEPAAAIITVVHRDIATVGLAVLNPNGLYFNEDVPFAEVPTIGCWNWPPRV